MLALCYVDREALAEGSPALGRLDGHGLVLQPNDPPVRRNHPVLDAQRFALLVCRLLLRENPFAVLLVDQALVQVRCGDPFGGARSEYELDLRTEIERLRDCVLGRVDVRDQRELLHECPVAELGAAELLLRFLPLAEVPDTGGEDRWAGDADSADRELCRKARPVGAHRLDLDATSEKTSGACRRTRSGPAGECSPVRLAGLRRHDERCEFASEDVVPSMAERLLRGAVELQNVTVMVDGDDRVECSFQDRVGVRFSRRRSRVGMDARSSFREHRLLRSSRQTRSPTLDRGASFERRRSGAYALL